jgi:glycosyltransferase involved in cell wall biosynthesis
MGTDRETEGVLRVLHVILHVNETNGQYNEHILPLLDVRDISICTYFEPTLQPPDGVDLFAGDGRLPTFFRVLNQALTTKEHDVIHVHAPQSGALVVLAMLLRLQLMRYRKAMVYTVQDSFYDYSLRNQALMVIALAGFNQVIFCSRSAYDSLPRAWKWLVGGRWHVVQNAADIDRVDRVLADAEFETDRDAFTVLAVGRLEPVKDMATLLGAFAGAKGDRAHLTLVGAGSLEGEIGDKVRELGLDDSVTLTGLIPRDDVFARCAAADVLVSTSHGEGLPVAVIEAMAAQCPVILSDIAPHRELADGADFIPLVPTGDVEGFSREIGRFINMSEADRRELGRRSREHVLTRFTLPIMHQGTEAVYRLLPSLAKPGSSSEGPVQ